MKWKMICGLCLGAVLAVAQRTKPLPRLKVSDNRRHIVQEDGKPFFSLADTARKLLQRLNRKEAAEYSKTRVSQGYSVVQALALAELEGLVYPNPYNMLPLIHRDPTRPTTPGANPADPAAYDYCDHVDFVIDEANRNGMYVGLLPTWSSLVVKNPRKDESIFTVASAQTYGEFLGKRYGKKGGDMDPTASAARGGFASFVR